MTDLDTDAPRPHPSGARVLDHRQELAAAEDRAFQKLAKDVRLPGFRKGKVPRKIFEQAYGGDTVTQPSRR